LDVRQIEHFLPLYRALRRWKDGSKVTVELPLFPSYLFVRITQHDRVRILELPGALSIAGAGREPTPVPDDEIETLRRWVDLSRVEPHSYLVVGERVRINAGPLAGMEGVLIRKKNSFRVVLTLSLIMQSVAVELDADDLEPAGTPRPAIALPLLCTA
jgi:transcription antitermination factor NusG